MKILAPFELEGNIMRSLGTDWMLITCGTKEKYNTMTASWGGMGILWNKSVVFTFIRPQRYTYEFMENNEYFSLSFYDQSWARALKFCGTNSGRDVNKAKVTGLVPVFDEKAPYFEQANLVVICRKLYAQDMSTDSIIDEELMQYYHGDDAHRLYVGEMVRVLVKDEHEWMVRGQQS